MESIKAHAGSRTDQRRKERRELREKLEAKHTEVLQKNGFAPITVVTVVDKNGNVKVPKEWAGATVTIGSPLGVF